MYSVNPANAQSIAIPLDFHGDQPNFFHVPAAQAHPFESGNTVGDTRKGGGCNFETVTLTPHCNGTHTECVGHITDERISIHALLEETIFPVSLVSVGPVPASQTGETFTDRQTEDDLIISKAQLESVLEAAALDGLIIRTLPNDQSKLSRQYNDPGSTPYFSAEAMTFIRDHGIQHLLVDLPSLDRLQDGGELINHHLFWNIPQGSHRLPGNYSRRTVTELVYVPDEIEDGDYLLNLQIAPFMTDAAPSRPIIFRLEDD